MASRDVALILRLVVLLATCVVPLNSQFMLESFPDDRSLCDSSSIPCMVGGYQNAAEFPVRRVTRPDPVVNEGFTGILNPINQDRWLLPDGFNIDYTGGLQLPPEDYVEPTSYTNDEGDTAFIGMNVTIVVNDTHYNPNSVSVLPGSTVTWLLETFETVGIRSDDGGIAFDSGPLNRNWSPTFSIVVHQEAVHEYGNPQIESWREGFRGRLVVSAYNCSTYTSCTTCLLYDQCVWCGSNTSCIERDPVTNLPLDTGIVAQLDYVDIREYQRIRYMEGYDLRTASDVIAWFPWPPIRRNPRKIPDSEVPEYFDTVSSDMCSAYKRDRVVETCEDYPVPPPKNRVHGIETANRPTLDEFFMCYEHLMTSWSRPDLPDPIVNSVYENRQPAQPRPPPPIAALASSIGWQALCCDVCSSCNASILVACNISCGAGFAASSEPAAYSMCPWESEQLQGVVSACSTQRYTNGSMCNRASAVNTTRCELVLSDVSWRNSLYGLPSGTTHRSDDGLGGGRGDDVSVGYGGSLGSASLDMSFATESRSGRRRLDRGATPDASGADDAQQQGQLHRYESSSPKGPLDTEYRPLAPAAPPLIGSIALAPTWEPRTPTRRRAQNLMLGGAVQAVVLTAWEQIPNNQRVIAGPFNPNIDMWSRLQQELSRRFGPRCNATYNCDELRGTCLNITGLPIIGHDQNGTCNCHAWFTGADCSQMILNEVTCAGMPDHEDCQKIKNRLYFCGEVEDRDGLPEVCLNQGLTVVQCGQAGHMRGHRNVTGTPNLIGRPENGYAAGACAKCMARTGITTTVRSETYTKACDPAIMLRLCQRQEDAWAQNICNYCNVGIEGSTQPPDRESSYFRGTREGSVEKRLRGIVPPNLDIVGHHRFGGLRYCKEPTTFTSTTHYYTDADIMKVGQTCLEGRVPTFEGWDYSRKFPCTVEGLSLYIDDIGIARDALNAGCEPNIVLDRFGLACLNPDDPTSCPKARNCFDGDVCTDDTPDFREIDELIRFWGLEKLKIFTDQVAAGGTCNYYVPRGIDPDQVLSTWYGGEGVLPIRCTFDQHSAILSPDRNIDSILTWTPFASRDYVDRYVLNVDWGFEAYDSLPPPPPT